MQYKFHAYGHPNILATHKTTLEFIEDEELSLKGDCIVGVKADFDLEKLKQFIKTIKNRRFLGHRKFEKFSSETKKNRIKIIIETISKPKIKEKIFAQLNPDFNSNKELVIRKTNFISKRTFAIKANKAAFELNKALIDFLREKENKIIVIVENK